MCHRKSARCNCIPPGIFSSAEDKTGRCCWRPSAEAILGGHRHYLLLSHPSPHDCRARSKQNNNLNSKKGKKKTGRKGKFQVFRGNDRSIPVTLWTISVVHLTSRWGVCYPCKPGAPDRPAASFGLHNPSLALARMGIRTEIGSDRTSQDDRNLGWCGR
ncbi:hypothetical protein BX600DRAFT_1637 [Xylariales sp. PMI_506]|nr:hypothetical protein BX600DRAFT_1637 [Xylariales sp. PMI_506]